MNRNFTWLAALILAATLNGSAVAQTSSTYDWTTSTEYRTTVEPLNLSAESRSRLNTEIHNHELEFGPVFMQERTALWPILTPEQRSLYDQSLSARSYYSIGLMTPAEYRAWRSGFDSRLNLTPDQRIRYNQITARTASGLEPINMRYQTRYTTVMTPDQWGTYRSGVVRNYVAVTPSTDMQMRSSSTQMESSSSAQSTEIIEQRRSVQTVQTVETQPMYSPPPRTQTETTQTWRNQDLK